ncbi:fatty acyl-CoA reductase wat isoform X2 [Drosophila takahashii]|uniref:fatty acyl-CoA reductase wat isoform X2 n=1 Tax=Drosophila takahashii TaxID=29030 RepID=UPI001CF80385|nr:fatty acyl-CoA reductase wat isoform X2 [Drosophila takahashii]
MQTDILKFYQNKTVFVTGGTGFLGKVIIEKLLRSTDVKRVYFLVRTKRKENVEGRFEAWKKEPVFEALLRVKPKALHLVTPISGDCSEPGLGLSEGDRRVLTTEVHVIIHSAASIRFVEPLHNALKINTRATRLMIQLAKEMQCLEAFVHISTAFSNCPKDHIEERFYPELLTLPANKVLEFNETLSPELLNNIAPGLMGQFPNTYTYTKALAEQVVQMEAQDLPICIFRPAIILANFKEPMSGWIDNLHGIVALIYGNAHGILRLLYVNPKAEALLVPGDYCANVALASGWHVAKRTLQPNSSPAVRNPPSIYTLATAKSNPITFGEGVKLGIARNHKIPVTKTIWFPFAHFTTCPWLFKLGCIFYHLLPGYLFDLLLRIQGKKSILIKSYHKIHEALVLLYPFSGKTYIMDMKNTNQMWKSMSPEDKAIFPFDMANLNWEEYFKRILTGMRVFLFKESWDTLEQAKRRLFRFYLMHRAFQLLRSINLRKFSG